MSHKAGHVGCGLSDRQTRQVNLNVCNRPGSHKKKGTRLFEFRATFFVWIGTSISIYKQLPSPVLRYIHGTDYTLSDSSGSQCRPGSPLSPHCAVPIIRHAANHCEALPTIPDHRLEHGIELRVEGFGPAAQCKGLTQGFVSKHGPA